jgi:hypothetical protein
VERIPDRNIHTGDLISGTAHGRYQIGAAGGSPVIQHRQVDHFCAEFGTEILGHTHPAPLRGGHFLAKVSGRFVRFDQRFQIIFQDNVLLSVQARLISIERIDIRFIHLK